MAGQRAVAWILGVVLPGVVLAADPPSVKLALTFRPVQQDVEYDIPDAKTYDQCKVTAIREGKKTGWLVLGSAGQTLRRYMDSDGDGEVDQFSYYRSGVEVYRDIDTNANNKVDQSRWLNIGGARWGVDANEDGKIDSWKRISAEESCKLAVKALVTQDATLLSTVLIDKDDLRTLGIEGDLETRILKSVSEPAAKIKKAGNSRLASSKTQFLRFDGANPGVVPVDQWNTTGDITVYENAMAIVDPGDNQPGLIQIGEMIRVGDVWKLTGIPSPLEGNEVELAFGFLVTPDVGGEAGSPVPVAGSLSEDERKLVEDLQALDKATPAPDASRREQARHNLKRADILASLGKLSKSDMLREQWLRQEVDSITAACQIDPTAEPLKRLKEVETEARKGDDPNLQAYVVYRRMLAEHALEMMSAESSEDRSKVNDKWLSYVEKFVDEFPKAEETADAALQLAIAAEFSGKYDDARKWYGRIARDFKEGSAVEKAGGAIRRLDLTGKTLALSGPGLQGGTIDIKQLKGRTVLVLFWTASSEPCREDLPELKKLYTQYSRKGFEVLGINLDDRKPAVTQYLQQAAVAWPQIHSPGNLDSPLAREFGVIALPTMFLVDASGKVVNRSINVAELKDYLGSKLK